MPISKPEGVTGVAAPGGYLEQREHNAALRGVAAYGDSTTLGWYEKQAAADGVAASCLSAAVLPIAQAEYEIAADESCKPEIVDFVRWAMLENLRPGFPATVRAVTKAALTYGFHVTEPLYRYVEEGPYKGKVTLRTLAPRPAWSIHRWDLDPESGEILGVEQSALTPDGRHVTPYIPRSDIVIFTHDREGDDPTGRSLFRPCFLPLKIKGLLLRLIGIRNEREAVGIPVATIPQGLDTKSRESLETALKNYRAHEKGYLIVPEGCGIQFPEGKAGSSDAMRADLGAINLEIRAAFLQHFQSLGTTETGSRAVGEVQADPFYLAEVAIAQEMIEPLNELIERLVIINFGPQECYPYIAPPQIRKEDVQKAIAPILDAVQKGGLTNTPDVEDRVRETLGLEPLDPAIAAQKLEQIKNPPPPPGPFGGPGGGALAPGEGEDPEGKGKGEKPATDEEDPDEELEARDPAAPLALVFHPPRLLLEEEQRVAFGEMSERFDRAGVDLQALIGNAIRRNRGELMRWARKHARGVLEGDDAALAALGKADLPKGVRAAITGAVETYAAEMYAFGRSHAERERRLDPAVAEREARKAAEAVREEIHEGEGEPAEDKPLGFADPEYPEAMSLFARLLWGRVRTEAQIHSDRIADELLRLIRLATTRAAQTQPRARHPDGSRKPYPALNHVLEDIERVITFSSESMAVAKDAALAVSVKAVSGGREEVFRQNADEIESITYSAVMDRNTCGTCSQADKTSAPSMDAVEQGAIPPTPNPFCQGTADRCRCIHVVRYK